MKKRTLKLLACAVVMSLTLFAVACGSDDAATTEEVVDVEVEEEADVETAEDADVETAEEADVESAEDVDVESAEDVEEEASNVAGDYSTLEEFYNDPAIKPALDSMFDAMAQDGMSVSLEVKENEFTVIIKIEDSSMIVDGMGEYLDQTLEAMAPTFEGQVAQFDDAIGEAGACTVVLRYMDPDDNVLSEKAFKAQ